jgi:hypothetical protein
MGVVSTILAAYQVFEPRDRRTALNRLARCVSRRSFSSQRHWFALWPSIPTPRL